MALQRRQPIYSPLNGYKSKDLLFQMGNCQARFSRSHSTKSKPPKTSTQKSTYKNSMPVYRTSRFTEHFDAPIMHLHDEMIDDCPLPFRSKKGGGSQPARSRPLAPISETGSSIPDPALKLSEITPSTPSSQQAQWPTHEPSLEPSKPLPSTPASRPPSRATEPSPSSLYSRGTDDSKPLPSTPDSSFLKQEPAQFIYRTDSGETCSSRLLFESTSVPPPLLVAALAVLTGEVSLEGIRRIDEYRFDLPRFNDYVNKVDIEKCGDEWHASQKVFEKYENAVMANAPDETYAQILASGYSSPGRANGSISGSPGAVGMQRMMSMDKIVERERGRSLTRREATGVKGIEGSESR